MKVRTKRENFFLILILGALSTVTPFSIDMYLPAFPQIAADLNATIAQVSFSVSTYFMGFAFGQLIYGPLLDRFGRKRPIYFGLTLYVLGCIGCLSAKTVEMLLIFRCLQALGGCVASVGSTAMVRDFFPVNESAKIFSLLMLVLGVSPLLAPTIGGFVVSTLGWQAVFGLLAAIVFTILSVVFFYLPEGHRPDPSFRLELKPILRNFKSILVKPQFYIYALSGSFSFAGLFVYITGSPAIFMGTFQVSAQVYGGIFAVLAVGFIGGSQLNLLLSRRYNNQTIFKTALMLQVLLSLIFLVGVINDWYGLIPTIMCLFALLLCAGLTGPNATAIALAPFSDNAGSAASVLGFVQIGLGSVISGSVGMLNVPGALPTAAVMTASSAIGLLILAGGKTRIHYQSIGK